MPVLRSAAQEPEGPRNVIVVDDLTNRPLSRVEIRVRWSDATEAIVETDVAGRSSIEVPRNHAVWLNLSKTGYRAVEAIVAASVLVSENDEPVLLRLRPLARVRGGVVGALGEVLLVPKEPGGIVRRARTTSGGTFQFDGVAPGPYSVILINAVMSGESQANLGVDAASRIDVDLAAGEDRHVTVYAGTQPTSSVSVTVSGTTPGTLARLALISAELPGAVILSRAVQGGKPVRIERVTHGAYELVAAGTTLVRAEEPSFARTAFGVGHIPSVVELQLEAGGSLNLALLGGKNCGAQEWARVALDVPQPWNAVTRPTLSSNVSGGKATFRSLPPGKLPLVGRTIGVRDLPHCSVSGGWVTLQSRIETSAQGQAVPLGTATARVIQSVGDSPESYVVTLSRKEPLNDGYDRVALLGPSEEQVTFTELEAGLYIIAAASVVDHVGAWWSRPTHETAEVQISSGDTDVAFARRQSPD